MDSANPVSTTNARSGTAAQKDGLQTLDDSLESGSSGGSSNWNIVFKKSCLGASHCNGNVELFGSFTYNQKNCATKEECDVVIETFICAIRESIADALTVKK